jgi:hypothetical protein
MDQFSISKVRYWSPTTPSPCTRTGVRIGPRSTSRRRPRTQPEAQLPGRGVSPWPPGQVGGIPSDDAVGSAECASFAVTLFTRCAISWQQSTSQRRSWERASYWDAPCWDLREGTRELPGPFPQIMPVTACRGCAPSRNLRWGYPRGSPRLGTPRCLRGPDRCHQRRSGSPGP